MVPPQKKDGITPRSHAAGGPVANQGGREREDMVANIHEFVNDPVGEINGTAYHLDFSDMPVESVSKYLHKHGLAPQFSKNGLCGVWDDKDRATDPFLLFSAAYAAEQEAGPSTSAVAEPEPAPKKAKKKASSKRAAEEMDDGDESEKPPPIRRRNTTTSMSAAIIEESLKMAQEEEDRRKAAERSDNGNGAGSDPAVERLHASDPQSDAQIATSSALEVGSDEPSSAAGPAKQTRDAAVEDKTAGQEGAASKDTGTVVDEAATRDESHTDGNAPEDEEMADAETGSPPALRRSSRKPVPAGTSLAKTHRDTRPSPSPTPSHDSEEEEEDEERFRPILADIDAAKDVLADRAARHWCETLAAGGGHTIQGPGVNPALAGQVMMGASAGGMMREGEAISEFLYAARLKGSALKIYKESAASYGQMAGGGYPPYT